MIIVIKILALIAAWIFFYKVLKSRNKSLAGVKATVVTLLFATLIFQFSDNLIARMNRAFSGSEPQQKTVTNQSSS